MLRWSPVVFFKSHKNSFRFRSYRRQGQHLTLLSIRKAIIRKGKNKKKPSQPLANTLHLNFCVHFSRTNREMVQKQKTHYFAIREEQLWLTCWGNSPSSNCRLIRILAARCNGAGSLSPCSDENQDVIVKWETTHTICYCIFFREHAKKKVRQYIKTKQSFGYTTQTVREPLPGDNLLLHTKIHK